MAVVIEQVDAEIAPENATRGADGQSGRGQASAGDAIKKAMAKLPEKMRRIHDRSTRLKAD